MNIKESFRERDESFTVYTYDNGYMVEVSGRDHDDEWITSKVICNSLSDVWELIKEITEIKVRR